MQRSDPAPARTAHPPELLDEIQRRALRERYLAHGLAEIEEAGKRAFPLVEEVFVPRGASRVVNVGAEKRVPGLCGIPPGISGS